MGQQYASIAEHATFSLAHEYLVSLTDADKNAFLLVASGILDGYLTGQFTLPLQPNSWGSAIKLIVSDIASWLMLSKRGFNPANDEDKNIRQRYEDAIALAKTIADGSWTPELIDANGLGGPGAGSGTGSGPDGGFGQGEPLIYSSSQRGYSTRGTRSHARSFEGD